MKTVGSEKKNWKVHTYTSIIVTMRIMPSAQIHSKHHIIVEVFSRICKVTTFQATGKTDEKFVCCIGCQIS